MPEKCEHARVTEHSKLYACQTLYEPAEYIYWFTCNECGEVLDFTDLDENTKILQEQLCTNNATANNAATHLSRTAEINRVAYHAAKR